MKTVQYQQNNKQKTIVWILNRLRDVGGGEKLLLEGVSYYRKIGYNVYIITWEFDEKVLLNGHYENLNIINLGESIRSREQILMRAVDRFISLFKYRKIITELNPNLIICQGEYDVAVNYIATLFLPIKYIFLIFGQMFQYPHDLGKYALVFKKYLKEIVASQQGYRETIQLQIPKTSRTNRLSNEVISIIRYFAVKKATARFTFSKSVQWETKLLFKVDTIRNQGAFKEIIFTEKFNTTSVKKKFNIPLEKRILLSFSRLDRKKRINVIIESLLYLPENYFLVIAGTGECEESLKELVQKHNLQDRILFLGFVEESNANSIKASADIFVSVDIGDFDISPLEAMALGCKAVVSTEFDLDDNLSKFHNLKSSIAEPKTLANVINELYICDPDTHYQEKLKEYTWESYFYKILKASNI